MTTGAASKPAICLAHGLINPLANACDAIMRRTYFTGIPEFLRGMGYRVLEPQVSFMGHVHERAAQLREQIAAWEEREKGERVLLVGHSMGGLDARWMISKLGGDDLIESLVTVGTPHRGTCVADTVVDGLTPVARYYDHLDSMGWSIRALECLTRAYMQQEFNPACLDSPDVKYYSVSGISEPEAAAAIIRPIFKIMLREEGVSDGLVSLESSKWGKHLGTFPVDHIEQIFLTPPAIAMYHSLLKAVDPDAELVPAQDVVENVKKSEEKLKAAQDPKVAASPEGQAFVASN